jgi:hypothetical protein
MCCCLVTAKQVGQKNRNGKTIVVFFPQCFFTSALNESQAFAYYRQCLLAMIGWPI